MPTILMTCNMFGAISSFNTITAATAVLLSTGHYAYNDTSYHNHNGFSSRDYRGGYTSPFIVTLRQNTKSSMEDAEIWNQIKQYNNV